MSQQQRTEIKCTDCGKTATVPFKPVAGKPVYCSDCLSKHRSTRAPQPFLSKNQGPTNEKQAWSRRRQDWK